jgi:hypothetical protein
MTADDAYSGILGAVPYAFRRTESTMMQTYVLFGAVIAVIVTLLFGSSLIVLIGSSSGANAGSLSFSRAFFALVAMAVVAPLVAPILFVARRHRLGNGDLSYDQRLGGLGFLFIASLYTGLVISTPEAQQAPAAGVLAPLVEALYSLPQLVGIVPPLVVAALIYVGARRY